MAERTTPLRADAITWIKAYRSEHGCTLIEARHAYDRSAYLGATHVAVQEERDAWQPIETAPKDGLCLLAIDTDDGYEFGVLVRDSRGNWIHEGEPTFCASYRYEPTHWMPLPKAPGDQP